MPGPWTKSSSSANSKGTAPPSRLRGRNPFFRGQGPVVERNLAADPGLANDELTNLPGRPHHYGPTRRSRGRAGPWSLVVVCEFNLLNAEHSGMAVAWLNAHHGTSRHRWRDRNTRAAPGILPDTLGSAVSSLRDRPQTCPAGGSGRIDRRAWLKDVGVSTCYEAEADVVAWASEPARLLRAGRFEWLDRDHLAEETEDVGKSEQRPLASRMALLLAHLLQWRYPPERRGASWEKTILAQRQEMANGLSDIPTLIASAGSRHPG